MKKKVPDFNPKNELVRELKDSEFVKNPLVYSQIRGDFTPMQTNVMVELVNTLQEKINEYLPYRIAEISVKIALCQLDKLKLAEIGCRFSKLIK